MLEALIGADGRRWAALEAVAALDLPQGCIGAGFVRNLVWDHLHDRRSDAGAEDVDVLWFSSAETDPGADAALEARLRAAAPGLDWSVRNQARMHLRNGDAPYASVEDAMRFWPETATAVALRWEGARLRAWAPFGFADLMGLVLRPASDAPQKRAAFAQRVAAKGWPERWPKLVVKAAAG